jgi:hypothetical protein
VPSAYLQTSVLDTSTATTHSASPANFNYFGKGALALQRSGQRVTPDNTAYIIICWLIAA